MPSEATAKGLRPGSAMVAAPVKLPDRLQHLSGAIEVKFKTGAFATWADVFARLEGRWLTVYKRERDTQRVSAIELGRGVSVTDVLNNPEASAKFPRRFDVTCKGGLLAATEISFRTKSRKDRDLWVFSIAANARLLASVGMDPSYGVRDLEPVIAKMKDAMPQHALRIRSDLTVNCATGESIVSFLVEQGIARDRPHAGIICKRMVVMNVIHHVVWEKDFTDSHEPFVINYELDDDEDNDLNYEADHFQKYLDSRKFWKYLDGAELASQGGSSYRPGGGASSHDSVGGSSTSSTRSNSRSALRSVNSAEWPAGSYNSVQEPSHLSGLAAVAGSGSSSSFSSTAPADTPSAFSYRQPRHLQPMTVTGSFSSSMSGSTTPDNTIRAPSASTAAETNPNAEAIESAKRAKKCSICSKSFNPLRRRHMCRACFVAVCGNCSVTRRSQDGSGDDSNTRLCISCKLSATSTSQEDFYDRIFAGPPTSNSVSSLSNGEPRTSITSHGSSSSATSNPAASNAKRRPSSNNLAGTRPPPAPTTSRGSLSSDGSAAIGGSDCSLCENEVCPPLRDLREVPYPVTTVATKTNDGFYAVATPLENESERIATVDAIRRAVQVTPSATRVMAQLCQMAAIASQCPMAAFGLLGEETYSLCAHYGVQIPPGATNMDEFGEYVPRSESYAAHTCRNGAPIVCRDSSRDIRFAHNPLRKGMTSSSDGSIFYVGMPLTLSTGFTVGCIEVWDVVPRFGPRSCLDVVGQLQAVARKLLKLLEDINAAAIQAQKDAEAEERARLEKEQQEKQQSNGDNEMERRLLELLSQTTSTQEQLRNQQTNMVNAISSHSKQIGMLAKQLERMEAALAAKLEQVGNGSSDGDDEGKQ